MRTKKQDLPTLLGALAKRCGLTPCSAAGLIAAGKTEHQLDELPHNLTWKMTLAGLLKEKHGANSTWIAQRMRFSSAAYLRKLLASA